MKFTEYRIAVRVVTTPDNEQFREYSLIEVFYDYDTYNPLYDKILESIRADMSDAERDNLCEQLPVIITSYTETNALRGWDVLEHLRDEYNDIQEAFRLPLIDLDNFPNELVNELSEAKTEQVAKEIAEMTDEKVKENIKLLKNKVVKQKVHKTLKKKTIISKNIKLKKVKTIKK